MLNNIYIFCCLLIDTNKLSISAVSVWFIRMWEWLLLSTKQICKKWKIWTKNTYFFCSKYISFMNFSSVFNFYDMRSLERFWSELHLCMLLHAFREKWARLCMLVIPYSHKPTVMISLLGEGQPGHWNANNS
jgi:hypothetical protein